MPTQHRGKSTRNNVGLVNIRHFCLRQMVKPSYLFLPQDTASRILGLVSDSFRERSPASRDFHAAGNMCRTHARCNTDFTWGLSGLVA